MTLVVAHRGASGYAPENTFEAYRLAVEMGADAIELDVHLTADGQLALIHDETLDRTTDRGGVVAELTMDAIREADAGYPMEAFRGRGLQVPTLPEVLEWLPAGTGLAVELKAMAAIEPTIAALRASEVYQAGKVSLISFHEAAIDAARTLDSSFPTGYILVPGERVADAMSYATRHGHAAIHPWDGDLGMDPSGILLEASAYGLLVGCYVVNDPERMRLLAAYGLWGFVTDMPDVGRAALAPG